LTNNGGCSHLCTDTYDSYYCHCRTGYEVVNEAYSCPSTEKKRKKRHLEEQAEEVLSRVRRETLSCGADVVFVLDSSGSIRDNNPADGSYDNWVLTIDFVHDLVDRFDLSKVRVGLLMFSNDAQLQFHLNAYGSDKNALLNRILDLKNQYLGGWTNTPDGIRMMDYDCFQSGNGDRSDADNIAVIITDGVSNPPDNSPYTASDTLPFAQDAKDRGIEIISVGVTQNVNIDEVKGMSSAPQELNLNYYLVRDFTDLADAVNRIDVCSVIDGGGSEDIFCRNTCDGTMCWCISNTLPINGTTCRDVNECNTNNGDCEDGCVNTDGSFYCYCRSGLRLGLNNMECEDVNECDDTSICNAHGGECVNTFGGYYCVSTVNEAVHASALAGQEAATVSASTNVATTTGIIIAVTLSAVNLVILAFVTFRWARRRQQSRHDDTATRETHRTGPFRAEAGTVRSFNSLAAKFGSPDAYNEDIARSTSLT